MTEPFIKLRLPCKAGQYLSTHHYSVHPEQAIVLTIYLSAETLEKLGGRDIDVSIEPIQTREERLREARAEALRRCKELESLDCPDSEVIGAVLHTIERVDAEFAKENPG